MTHWSVKILLTTLIVTLYYYSHYYFARSAAKSRFSNFGHFTTMILMANEHQHKIPNVEQLNSRPNITNLNIGYTNDKLH
jgi:hypothetical protein